jgi:ArsR family transcriptional regulator, arsenate/arsenite/antimonite-responsive transcriptional repressor
VGSERKRPVGEPRCEPVVYPDVERQEAERMAAVAKALGDQLADVLGKHASKICVCELVPLFDVEQPTVSHHLKVLREAGIVGSERRGLWAYYYVEPGALEGLRACSVHTRGVGRPRDAARPPAPSTGRAGRSLRALRPGLRPPLPPRGYPS